jgi:hypothetical protein
MDVLLPGQKQDNQRYQTEEEEDTGQFLPALGRTKYAQGIKGIRRKSLFYGFFGYP